MLWKLFNIVLIFRSTYPTVFVLLGFITLCIYQNICRSLCWSFIYYTSYSIHFWGSHLYCYLDFIGYCLRFHCSWRTFGRNLDRFRTNHFDDFGSLHPLCPRYRNFYIIVVMWYLYSLFHSDMMYLLLSNNCYNLHLLSYFKCQLFLTKTMMFISEQLTMKLQQIKDCCLTISHCDHY